MKNLLSIFLSILFVLPAFSQATMVEYQEFNNGELNEDNTMELIFSKNVVHLSKEGDRIRNFIDYNRHENVAIIEFEGKTFKNITLFDSLSRGVETERIDTILNYICKHRTYNYFSNKIDVFYTEETAYKGSPYLQFNPSENGLVLKIIINGSRIIQAKGIKILNEFWALIYPYEEAKSITKAEFEEIKIKSRFKTLSVFRDQIINFDPGLPKEEILDTLDDHIYRCANGTIVLKKIKLPEMVKKGTYTFLKLSCKSNGDAYDRTGSVFTILPNGELNILHALNDSIQVIPSFSDNLGRTYHGFRLEQNFVPALEWMRFFTSFGVDHFNQKRVINNYSWLSEATYKQDISLLIPSDRDELWVGVFIGNYDKGGHIINMDLEFFPSFANENPTNKWILPLFNSVNIMEMAGQEYPRLFDNDTLELEFHTPENVDNIQLLYTSTGHGGWENGDEFNQKLNRIYIDGKEVFRIVPWRSDCAKYRLYNPASGNFSNGLSSSDFSRSNWCPATSTPPYFIPLPHLSAGSHTLKVIIDQGKDEGSSFNAWGISGVLVGNKK